MKNICLLGFLFFSSALCALDGWVEGKAAYFFPSNDTFREVYSGGGIYGVEATCQIYSELYGWASGSYFGKSGKSIGEGEPTRIYFVPIGFGIKHYNDLWKWEKAAIGIDVAIGATYTFVHMENSSPFVAPKQSKWGWGGTAKAGVLFTYSHFLAHVFVDYSYLKVNFPNSTNPVAWGGTSNLSGVSVGGSLGIRF